MVQLGQQLKVEGRHRPRTSRTRPRRPVAEVREETRSGQTQAGRRVHGCARLTRCLCVSRNVYSLCSAKASASESSWWLARQLRMRLASCAASRSRVRAARASRSSWHSHWLYRARTAAMFSLRDPTEDSAMMRVHTVPC